jgi:hypothetical protein
MIDKNVLRQLGWSDLLIDAVDKAAEPFRQAVIAEVQLFAPTEQFKAVSSTFVYSEAATDNIYREIAVQSQDEL